ncbi:MAG TPA: outer membrane lipoprotein-sorting protein [Spirochaetota bacterium]|nr:outer membrane lipoprotein-sorting protein [Spirochaetota bacterium]HOM37725.1 outer membrane lipoprotein-sorting protein [Spirochaetota bacterium]HPQ49683.1 outer membrane lipoprotein-sorting protein [Spirochaetota bacterium]
MKKAKKIILALLLPIGLIANDNYTGRQIAEMAKDANKSKSRIVEAELTVIENGKEIETRSIGIRTLRENNLDKVLFRFTSGLKRDVTFLSLEQPGDKDNIQYIYIPNVGRPRQIASSEKQNDFEDTVFTNEDLGGRKIDDYNYNRLPDQEVKNGNETFQCYVIEATSKDKNAKFPKIKMWIDKATLLPVRYQSFGKDGKPVRIGISANVKEIKKGIYMPYFVNAKDLETKRETKMVVKNVIVDPNINPTMFNPQNIHKPW